MAELNEIGKHFIDNIQYARGASEIRKQKYEAEPKVNVIGAGGAITSAFEQLRNAAENTEEHLLLQGAIRRFFKRVFVTSDDNLIEKSGDELIVELTLAGYLENDSVTKNQCQEITDLALDYYRTHNRLLADKKASGKTALAWTLDVLAVRAESVLNDHSMDTAFVGTSYEYLSTLVSEKERSSNDYSSKMLVAIYRSLLKSNEAVARTDLLLRYDVNPDEYKEYIDFNKQLDKLFESKSAVKLTRFVTRQGAPLRILRRMMQDQNDMSGLLQSRENFLNVYEQRIHEEYDNVESRLNKAIIRSVIFLIITKFIVGIAMEVPYDLVVYKQIHWVPLLINLFFPPVYMLLLRSTLKLPSKANTAALMSRAEAMFYRSEESLSSVRSNEKRYSGTFSAIYAISALLIFAGATWLLIQLGFSWLHIVIFFVFFSAASFLGFRLSRLVRELEVVREHQDGFTFLRDLIYLPFAIIGQWMNEKYSKVNIVTAFLDMVIELPLKTSLRLMRQWNAFIDDRKDNI